MRKGIVLSGGLGTRLYPCTEVISKQLLPVYDKPLIFYPISTLMMAGIRDIMVITSPENNYQFQNLLKDGSQWGINICYATQKEPKGIADALLIASGFIGKDDFALILGDNIYYGNDMMTKLQIANDGMENTLFAYHVADPERFGVLETDSKGVPIRIHEKPKEFVSNYAITGLYFYNNNALSYAEKLKPSARGELEITDLNNVLMENKEPMWIEYMNRGIAWIDTGTFDSLADASIFVASIQKRTGTMICCPEEIAYRNTWIDREKLLDSAERYSKSDYGAYLRKVANEQYRQG